MPTLAKGQATINIYLADEDICGFVKANLKQTLPSIGFSDQLVRELVNNLGQLDAEEFIKKHSVELDKVFTGGFFQDIVPRYFEKYVIPEIPSSQRFLDIGCGTGILIKRLSKIGKFGQLTGIDVLAYPEWEVRAGEYIKFQIISEEEFPGFLADYQPDSIALTWTLHHMPEFEQKKYISLVFSNMKAGSKLVILEDAYSETLPPENGLEKYEQFMKWDKESRKKIMSVYDWIANRVLAQREDVPVTFTYRTMEEWIELFESVGFKCQSRKFIGFPDERDINTPQSLMVFER